MRGVPDPSRPQQRPCVLPGFSNNGIIGPILVSTQESSIDQSTALLISLSGVQGSDTTLSPSGMPHTSCPRL